MKIIKGYYTNGSLMVLIKVSWSLGSEVCAVALLVSQAFKQGGIHEFREVSWLSADGRRYC